MYNDFYNLKENPFRLTPDPAFLYMTEKHREALSGLVYSICNKAGLTVLVGEAGTGKTTLLQVLRDWLAKRQFVTALCTNPTLTREEFLDLLLAQLGISCPSTLKSRQLIALEEALLRYRAEGRRSVLIVDEAHRLSAELLEEIRLLLNMETPREKFLDIIIAGQPELAETFARPELRQLKQRVSCYCHLDPLIGVEVREYVHHRLAQAGLPQQTLFPNDTIEIIEHYTHGIPRLVSSLCDGALQTGFAMQVPLITPSIIHEAAKDLEMHEVPKETPLNRNHETVAPEPVPVLAAANVAAVNQPDKLQTIADRQDKRGTGVSMPLESYSNRQRSLGFLGSLIDRWT